MPQIKPKPIGPQPGKMDNSHIPLTCKYSKSSVVGPLRKDNNSSKSLNYYQLTPAVLTAVRRI